VTEKKTFKHPRIVYTWINDEIVGWGLHQFPAESFSSDEWDMEVTFTRKQRPLKLGDRVDTHTYGAPDNSLGTVVYITDKETVSVVWDVRPDSVQDFWNIEKLFLVEDAE
jgi:hypothetical protein